VPLAAILVAGAGAAYALPAICPCACVALALFSARREKIRIKTGRITRISAGASRVETDTTFGTSRTDQASIVGQATVPLYDDGLASSQVRQAKETLGQLRVVLDQTRRANDTAVATNWSTNEGAKTAIAAGEAEVRAAEIALAGVGKEREAGKRTTIDVLNANQDLMAARLRLIQAERDRVVASCAARRDRTARSQMARAQVHYSQVRDAWHGLRTPEGR
jgi:outer membrane protein